jgi:prepilin-type N-terminal cleavage/methylation domain-containing protein
MQLATTRRTGMTLIELLVVMTIIAVLASLSIGAIFSLRESQMKSFTETTVQKLASALDQQWKAALDQIREEISPPPPPPQVGTQPSQAYLTWTWALQTANGEPRRARAIYTKARLKQEFPVTFYQAKYPYANSQGQIVISPAALPAKPAYKQALAGITTLPVPVAPTAFPTPPVPVPADYESSALLFLALSQGRRGMAAFSPDEIDPAAIQQQGNFKVFVDTWGKALRYYAFPYFNDELNGSPYVSSPGSPLGKDPQDTEGTLNGYSSAAFLAIHPLNLRVPRHLIPVVASAGRDGDWGDTDAMNGPLYMLLTNAGANDNIYSYRLRQFGARGD